MNKLHSYERMRLIARIKGLAQQTAHIKKVFRNKSFDPNSWDYNSHKKYLGEDARNHNLAYAFMRGVPYNKIEPKSHTKPHARSIAQIVVQTHGISSWAWQDTYTTEIKKWIDPTYQTWQEIAAKSKEASLWSRIKDYFNP
jgi:hypothetical protein